MEGTNPFPDNRRRFVRRWRVRAGGTAGQPRSGRVLHEAQVIERHAGNRGLAAQPGFPAGPLQVGAAQAPRRPPSPQGVVEQEAHHVGLGEELGDRGQLTGADLDLGTVHFGLLPGLPELVDPTEGIGGREHFGRQTFKQSFQLQPVFPREPDLEDRKVGTEHLGQHPMGETCGQRPLVRALVLRQFLAFVQGDGDTHFGFDEQVVFGEESGEQHAVPMLVSTLLHQAFDRSAAGAYVERIAELPGVGAQPPA